MKNQKGVTLVALSITIILFTVVLTAITFSSVSSTHVRRLSKMYEDVLLLQGRVNVYYLQNNALPIDTRAVETFNTFKTKIQTIVSDSSNKLLRTLKVNPNDCTAAGYGGWDAGNYAIININLLKGPAYGGDFELNNQRTNDYYAINKRSLQVYYCNGVVASEDATDIRYSIPFDKYTFVSN